GRYSHTWTLICHVGHAVCRLSPPEGGLAMSKTRPATPTVAFIDQYCAQYRHLFKNVRHFEHFTALPLGLLAETRHKSLPQLGKTVHTDPQALHHLLAKADWSVEDLRTQRLDLLRQALGTRRSSCVSTRPATARKGTPPTTA